MSCQHWTPPIEMMFLRPRLRFAIGVAHDIPSLPQPLNFCNTTRYEAAPPSPFADCPRGRDKLPASVIRPNVTKQRAPEIHGTGRTCNYWRSCRAVPARHIGGSTLRFAGFQASPIRAPRPGLTFAFRRAAPRIIMVETLRRE